jgi:hypothetical protein
MFYKTDPGTTERLLRRNPVSVLHIKTNAASMHAPEG